ncbi:MAG: class I SAM-dependent methyltransferase [candidate division WOR-3 bacterium]
MISVFDIYYKRYDEWYEKPFGKSVFKLEAECLRRLFSIKGKTLEIGVGSGRFARELNITFGLDPSRNLIKLAKERGIRVVIGKAEDLPFKDGVFDGILIVVSICFFEDPLKALREAKRVLKEGGILALGMVLRESPWGRFYEEKGKMGNPFYSSARFYSFEDVKKNLKIAGFSIERVYTTLFEEPQDKEPIKNTQIKEGYYPQGGFHCILAKHSP